MRRAMLAALGVIALALASPGAALAHHRGHHRHHRNDKTRAHHARVHFEHFGARTPLSPSPSAGKTSSDSEPLPPTPSEDAGKVVSFEKEALTVALSDGSIVSGKVTSATRIECVSASSEASTEQAPGDDKGSGDDQNREGDQNQQVSGQPTQPSGDEQSSAGDQQSSDEDEQQASDGEEGTGDDDTSTAASEPPCDTSALAPGTVVREAELRVGPSGAEWESVELVR